MIHSRQIPTADTDRLRDELARLHEMYHLPEGLWAFSGPRRQLVDEGRWCIAIALELVRRGSIPTPCRYCLPDRNLLDDSRANPPRP